MAALVEIEVLCQKVDRLAEEIKDLQHVVRQLKPPEENATEDAWQTLLALSEEVSAKWHGPDAVEEIRVQRGH